MQHISDVIEPILRRAQENQTVPTPADTVWEQLERIQAQIAFQAAQLQRILVTLERLAGKSMREQDQTGFTAEMHSALGTMRVPGGHKDP